ALVALGAPLPAGAALSASVADLTLPALAYSHQPRTVTGSLTLTARDTGSCLLLICSNDGWHVTIQSSSFAYSGTNAGSAIPAANFAVTQANAPTRISGDAISAQGGPRVPANNSTGSLDVARETLEAADGYGMGEYRQVLDVSLAVPGQARAGTYRATLTVTISAGP
ncbi:MAG TPA: WxL domain-containing protein, partial [Candidatus Limnocylindria bacterium]|nr:WxL domain-containing protein [Candidatus Limnocylindria bacterium]